jgi:uncharacterized protein (TIGR02246 family)
MTSEDAINVLRSAFEAAYSKGDAAAVANLFTDDALLLPPGTEPVAGKEGIQGFTQSMFDQFRANLSITVRENQMFGDSGFGLGSYENTLTPKAGGGPMKLTGRWLNIVKRQADGSLKIARHCWNSDQPFPGLGH